MLTYLAALLVGVFIGRRNGVVEARSIVRKYLYTTPLPSDTRDVVKHLFRLLGGNPKKVRNL